MPKQQPKTLEELAAENAELKAQLATERQAQKIRAIASEHIRPGRIKYAEDDLRRHVLGLPKEQQAKLDEKELKKFFAKLATDEPDFAHPAPAAAPATAKPAAAPAVRARVHAGSRPGQRPLSAPSTVPTAPLKTAKPNQHNTMNKRELQAALKSQGLKGWMGK